MFVPCCVCERPRSAVTLPYTSLSFPPTFIVLLYNQFELIKLKLKNKLQLILLFLVDYKFHICYRPLVTASVV
jgi:hypothetical protein